MGLVSFILLCLVIGLIVWLINTYTPIPGEIKKLILVVSIIVLVLILLGAMGVFQYDVPIPRVR